MKLLRLLPFSALLLFACKKSEESTDSKPVAALTEEEIAAKEAKIEELENEIENSTNLISDMDAFIMMERAKIEDNPNYDQSFMEEALSDQDEQREKIKTAQKALKELKK